MPTAVQIENPIAAPTLDGYFERLMARAATIDELLTDAFEPLHGQKGDTDLSARRLAAWCRACASGDWSLFARRLERDRQSIAAVLERFATVRRNASAVAPLWIKDAIWIDAALQGEAANRAPHASPEHSGPYAFEQLFTPVVEQAEALLRSGIAPRICGNLNDTAHGCLRAALLKELSELATPALYELFAAARKTDAIPPGSGEKPQDSGTARYDLFVTDMKTGGWRRLFEDKPVLLRLIATIVRQWIDTSRELLLRLDADLIAIRRDLLDGNAASRIAAIQGGFSDPHNAGHSVQIVSFEDGARVVYKPKDLRIDVAWHALIERLNGAKPPLELKAVRAIARDGYGWTEFIEHTGCADQEGCKRFFRRAGAWLALLHCFAATDMHQENMIAAGEHPVPIDLETILHATAEEDKAQEPDAAALAAAMETIANSVATVGLLPAYGRSPQNNVFAVGGMTADWNSRTVVAWHGINTDAMRPASAKEIGKSNPNLPHVDGRYAKFGDHIDDFVAGFEDYANFLLRQNQSTKPDSLFEGFAGLPVRKVIRPTRFYYMLLQRLRNHRSMDDGVSWSAQADFIARLSEWQKETDPLWPLQQAERSALLALNVPHFVSPCDGDEIRDASGIAIRTEMKSGLDRAKAHVKNLDERDIAWQIDVIRQNTHSVSRTAGPAPMSAAVKAALTADVPATPTREVFVAEADHIAVELSRAAIKRGTGAAWIGLDWLGDSEVFQLIRLGPELYNGASGIALFLAAHAAVTGCAASGELALAGVRHVRNSLTRRNAARLARSLGIGGAAGLGSIIYAFAVMARCLDDKDLLADAHAAAELFTDDLIAADLQLDVIGGSAGAILGLLRLYRDARSSDVLKRATQCGEHLLGHKRLGADGLRSWVGQGFGARALNGMSHGAAGFAYALASLAAATGREDFAEAAAECIAFEDASYDAEHNNWPDRRADGSPGWPCQWCHGAPGIGLARIAMTKRGGMNSERLATDIRNAVAGTERGWPGRVDTLCCGTLASIEFFCEAAGALGRNDLREMASRRLVAVLQTAASAGDFRWNSGKRQFNLGLFRGLAGVGYTLLRQADGSLPNVLIWE
jgi:type 2 lantibiotic biosynthesis protein LanM